MLKSQKPHLPQNHTTPLITQTHLLPQCYMYVPIATQSQGYILNSLVPLNHNYDPRATPKSRQPLAASESQPLATPVTSRGYNSHINP